MTVTPFPRADLASVPAPTFDVEKVLASIDTMAAQKPVAAQIVSIANSDDTDARTLAQTLASDVALAGRVMKLANSAYFGMRGRVTSLQFAVTVVGFTTVRTMATVALTDLDDESRLPKDFWRMSTCVALGASTLAPRFGERPQDALCLGLLAPLGVALLHQLREIGVRLSVDDFGTGYSSLAYLRHLPVDCLKVDRSFVAELAEGHAEIASAVIALARSLDLKTVAEGVETEEQAAQLTALGAGYLQGFDLAQPMTGHRTTAWYAAHAR